MKFVNLPEGGRIEVELNEEQVQLFIEQEIKRQVRARLDRFLQVWNIKELVRNQTRDIINNMIQEVLPLNSEEHPHDAMSTAVGMWLDRRQGWVATQLRRGQRKNNESEATSDS